MVKNRTIFTGKNGQRDQELLEDASAKACETVEMWREQPTIQRHNEVLVDASASREDPVSLGLSRSSSHHYNHQHHGFSRHVILHHNL